MRINYGHIFTAVFLVVFVVLNIVSGLIFADFSKFIYQIIFALFVCTNIIMAYGLTEFLMVLIIKPNDLPKRKVLRKFPKVALLYTTKDDVMPRLLLKLKKQDYPNYEIFVLDDSEKKQNQKTIDRLAKRIKATVIRRKDKRGFKAGNLNNWLFNHSDGFEYFIIVDADSDFENDFVSRIVLYAAHPSNSRVAIFQSFIQPWNTNNLLSKTMSATAPLGKYISTRITNTCGYLPAWGHNNLHRIKHLKAVGGFDTGFISEDFATAMTLLSRGYQTKLVGITSYELFPTNLAAFAKRLRRWVRQSVEIEFKKESSIPFATRLHMFFNTFSYFAFPLYFIGGILAVWSYSSSFTDMSAFLSLVLTKSAWQSGFLSYLLLLLFYIFVIFFIRLPISIKAGVKVKDYFMSIFLSWGLTYYSLGHVLAAFFDVFFGPSSFIVSPKVTKRSRNGFLKICTEMKPTLLLILILVLGLCQNKLALILNAVWVYPLIFSPVIAFISEKQVKKPTKYEK